MGSNQPNKSKHKSYIQNRYFQYDDVSHYPGNPIFLKYNSHLKKDSNLPVLIDKYFVEIQGSLQEVERCREVYQRRMRKMNGVVQVFDYEVEGSKVYECFRRKYEGIIFTEHLECRLSDFRSKKYLGDNKYDYLSYNSAIFILLSILQIFNNLSMYYPLHFPTSKAIGIKNDGLVKVWINQNFAINKIYHLCEKQILVVEEIIVIVEDRMKGNFRSLFGNNYQIGFCRAQEILSQELINFHAGKKELMSMINQRRAYSCEKKSVSRSSNINVSIVNKETFSIPKKPFERKNIQYSPKKSLINFTYSSRNSLYTPPLNHSMLPIKRFCSSPSETAYSLKHFGSDFSALDKSLIVYKNSDHLNAKMKVHEYERQKLKSLFDTPQNSQMKVFESDIKSSIIQKPPSISSLKMEIAPQSQPQSLKDITEQFKSLLQSSLKIEIDEQEMRQLEQYEPNTKKKYTVVLDNDISEIIQEEEDQSRVCSVDIPQ